MQSYQQREREREREKKKKKGTTALRFERRSPRGVDNFPIEDSLVKAISLEVFTICGL